MRYQKGRTQGRIKPSDRSNMTSPLVDRGGRDKRRIEKVEIEVAERNIGLSQLNPWSSQSGRVKWRSEIFCTGKEGL